MRSPLRLITFFVATVVFPLILTGRVFAADFTITGTAIDDKNNPVVNAKVTVTNDSTQQVVVTTTSDQSGYYTFLIPKGTYTIITSPPLGSGLQSVTDSHITIVSDLSLHNNLKTIGNSPNGARKNFMSPTIRDTIGWAIVVAFIISVIAAVGVALTKKKK
jgi:hypothetical protein